MKTNISRDTARRMRDAYLEKAIEVERERREYQNVIAEIKDAENNVVSSMISALRVLYKKYERPISAREVWNEMGGENGPLTYQEVVSILTVAANEHWNGSGRTKKSRFPILSGIKDSKDCRQYYKTVTRHFAEIDENGHLIPGGALFEKSDLVCTYTINE